MRRKRDYADHFTEPEDDELGLHLFDDEDLFADFAGAPDLTKAMLLRRARRLAKLYPHLEQFGGRWLLAAAISDWEADQEQRRA